MCLREDSRFRHAFPYANGFTLIELLTVIAVIGILAALLLPVLVRARERAGEMACMAHLLQISRAQLLYLQDWDERFLPWWQPAPRQAAPSPEMLEEPSGPTSHLHRSRHRFWTDLLQPYLCDSGVLRDPGGSGAVREARGEWLTDYALNTWGPGGRGTQDDPYFHWPGPGLTLPDVARPAETITLMDGLTTTRETLNAATRHRNGMIAAFVDGHARWLSLSQFWRTDTNGDGFYWLQYGAVDR